MRPDWKRPPLNVNTSVYLTPDEAQALELLASHDGRSVSAYVRRLIQLALNEALAEMGERTT